MKIALVSIGSPQLVSTWSGIPSFIAKTLESKGHHIIPVAITRPQEPWYYDWLRRIYYRLGGVWFLSSVEPFILRQIGSQVDDSILKINPDLVICIHADPLAFSTFTHPSIIVHDATFHELHDYYDCFSNLSTRSIEAGNRMFQLAMDKCSAAVFSSQWASDSAQLNYNVQPSKLYTIPFGANLDTPPPSNNISSWIAARSMATTSTFLFLGVDWLRKGGPDALLFVRELNRLGIAARLTIIGCSPDIASDDLQYVTIVGFLDKSIPDESLKLECFLISSTALILPSVAECYGCVYCEANAFGLPVIGRRTGGVDEIIHDKENGILMEPGETPEDLALRWMTIWTSRDAYINMSISARHNYESRLNYGVFADRLLNCVVPPILSGN